MSAETSEPYESKYAVPVERFTGRDVQYWLGLCHDCGCWWVPYAGSC